MAVSVVERTTWGVKYIPAVKKSPLVGRIAIASCEYENQAGQGRGAGRPVAPVVLSALSFSFPQLCWGLAKRNPGES